MMPAPRFLFWMVLLGVTGAAQCSRSARPSRPTDSDTVLDCVGDIRHVLRIRADGIHVEDLSSVPAKLGDAEVGEAEYRLRFQEPRDNYEVFFQIDRSTGKGTRRMFDDEQQAIRGHGGTDDIICTPYRGQS